MRLILLTLITIFLTSRKCYNCDCKYNNIPLHGRVKIVKAFATFKVKIVTSLPDLNVQQVKSLPKNCGEWQFVNELPDFTIQIVDNFPDFAIKFVSSFPRVENCEKLKK